MGLEDLEIVTLLILYFSGTDTEKYLRFEKN